MIFNVNKQTLRVKNLSTPPKITRTRRCSLFLYILSLLSFEVFIPPGFMPGSIAHGKFINPCESIFPNYTSDISDSSHHHHHEETEIDQGCTFASQLSDPVFVIHNLHGNPKKTYSTDLSKIWFYQKSSRSKVNPRAPPYLREC